MTKAILDLDLPERPFCCNLSFQPMTTAFKALAKTFVASPERQQEADSDWVVVRRIQAGDVASFDQLILKYRERVYAES